MKSIKTLSCLLISLLSACGGGGGGSESSGGSKESAATGVRILHAVIDTAPVEISSSLNPGEVVTGGFFAEKTLYGELSQAEQILSVAMRTVPTEVYDTAAITVEKNKHYSLLFFGNQATIGLRSAVINDEPGDIPAGSAAVKVVHGLVGASQLNMSFSDGQNANGTAFGSASEYVFVPAGLKTIIVKRASDGLVVGNFTVELASGAAYSVLMAGEIDFFVAARLLED